MKKAAKRTMTKKAKKPGNLSAGRAGAVRGGAETYSVKDKKKVEVLNPQR